MNITAIIILVVYGKYMFLMRDEKEERKKQARSKAKQHSTPKVVTFS